MIRNEYSKNREAFLIQLFKKMKTTTKHTEMFYYEELTWPKNLDPSIFTQD